MIRTSGNFFSWDGSLESRTLQRLKTPRSLCGEPYFVRAQSGSAFVHGPATSTSHRHRPDWHCIHCSGTSCSLKCLNHTQIKTTISVWQISTSTKTTMPRNQQMYNNSLLAHRDYQDRHGSLMLTLSQGAETSSSEDLATVVDDLLNQLSTKFTNISSDLLTKSELYYPHDSSLHGICMADVLPKQWTKCPDVSTT